MKLSYTATVRETVEHENISTVSHPCICTRVNIHTNEVHSLIEEYNVRRKHVKSLNRYLNRRLTHNQVMALLLSIL